MEKQKIIIKEKNKEENPFSRVITRIHMWMRHINKQWQQQQPAKPNAIKCGKSNTDAQIKIRRKRKKKKKTIRTK